MREQAVVDRLRDEVGRAAVVGAVDRRDVVERRHHQDGDGRTSGHRADARADGEAVEARHDDVEQDDVGTALSEELQCLHPALGADDLELAVGERLGGDHAHHLVVVDEEDEWSYVGFTLHCSPPSQSRPSSRARGALPRARR